MATYIELLSLLQDSLMQGKAEVAVSVSAQTILSGADIVDPPWDQTTGQHDIRAKWAADAIAATKSIAREMLWYVLAANRDLSVSQIQGASDSAIQEKADEAVDEIAKARYGA